MMPVVSEKWYFCHYDIVIFLSMVVCS